MSIWDYCLNSYCKNVQFSQNHIAFILSKYLHGNAAVPADGEARFFIKTCDQLPVLIGSCIPQRSKLISVRSSDHSDTFFSKLVNDLTHTSRTIPFPSQRKISKVEFDNLSPGLAFP